MLVSLSNFELDQQFYKLGLQRKFGQKVNFFTNTTGIPTNQIINASNILLLNSVSETVFLKTYKKILKLNPEANILVSKQYPSLTNIKSPKVIKIDYLNLAQVEKFANKDLSSLTPYVEIPKSILKIFVDKYPCPIFFKQSVYMEQYKGQIGKNSLYIKREDFEIFSANYLQKFLASVHKIQSKHAALPLISLIHQDLKLLGIRDENILATNALIVSISKEISNSPFKRISSALSKFYKMEDFIPSHSLTTCYLLTAMVEELNYPNKSQILKKLISAALFHDLNLPKAICQLELGLSEENISQKSQAAYNEHPQKVIDFFKKSSLIDEEVANIIKYHHEKPDGSGLYGLTHSSTPPLVALFIIAHEFAVCSFNNYQNKNNIMFEIETTFSVGPYKKYIKALKSIVANLSNGSTTHP